MYKMKVLIVEDDFSSRFLLHKFLEPYGTCYIAINGKEAVEAVKAAMDAKDPYDLICLDIMMPELDGHNALKQIRQIEEERGIVSSEGAKIIMTTALGDMKNINDAFHNLCDSYLTKPISKTKLLRSLHTLGFLSLPINIK
jgi:two-component system, chemotaxis family, chemotaxis protein CheY